MVESVKAASDIYAPLAGAIVAANPLLDDTPDAINNDPYGEGWIFQLAPSDPGALALLLDAAAYQQVVADDA